MVFILYIISGIFGYFTFATATQYLTDSQFGGIILMADYNKNIAVVIVSKSIFRLGDLFDWTFCFGISRYCYPPCKG